MSHTQEGGGTNINDDQPNINALLLFGQLEAGGKTRGEAPQDAEREEHLRLLAESHSTSLDLRWKLQHGEKRWGRERADLLERFDTERQEWDADMKELHHKMERVGPAHASHHNLTIVHMSAR